LFLNQEQLRCCLAGTPIGDSLRESIQNNRKPHLYFFDVMDSRSGSQIGVPAKQQRSCSWLRNKTKEQD